MLPKLISAFFATALLSSQAAPYISEFLASNQNGLQDEDGSRPDWIEIHNPDATPVDLTGWYLTDNSGDLTKWAFPATTLAPHSYLVVFASDKNRRTSGQPLHTNFSLSVNGEFLALVQPDGTTIASSYDPSFPAQFSDISYGIPSSIASSTLISPSASCRWRVPASSANPGSSWIQPSFSDSSWTLANLGLGYDPTGTNTGGGIDFRPEIGSNGNTQSAMYNVSNAGSCFIRIPFTVDDTSQVLSLSIKIKYDDGFILWLNGQPVRVNGNHLTRNAPASPVWNSVATSTHDDALAIQYETFDISENLNLLTNGANILAVQALNQSTGSSDFLFRTELLAGVYNPSASGDPAYFATATPGAPNPSPENTVIPQSVTFSRPSGTYTTASFSLTLGGASSGQQIRYTLDGSVPTAASTLYTGPITINSSTQVRARIVSPSTGSLGFVGSAHYERLHSTLSNYNSTGNPFFSSLPVVVINNRGAGEPPNNDVSQPARIQIFDRSSEFSSLSSNPVISRPVAVKLRGRSSSGFPKKSYGIEFTDEFGEATNVSVLDMPAHDDWALISCWHYDRAFARNALIYELSRRMGRWAPRTRLVEVFFNKDGDTLEYADYQGVYLLCESIRVDPMRVDVRKLQTYDTTLPDLSGGFIFKVDAADADEFFWTTNNSLPPSGTGGDGLVIHRPKLPNLGTGQASYLVNYFQAFETTLLSEAAAQFPSRHYRNYIDSSSWADHNLLCALAKNVDALRLSAYFHKDRGRPMHAGPLWDFDRSLNSTDPRDNDTNSWRGTEDSTNYFTYAWWNQLFQDQDFRQLWVDRWQSLRTSTLATAEVNQILDDYLAEFRPGDTVNPATRDNQKWLGTNSSYNSSYSISTEVQNLKSWISSRSTWIDGQFTQRPSIALPSGNVNAGVTTTIAVPSGTAVYYTLNGTDPRASGGGLSSSAITYNGTPITINATTRLVARAFRSGSYAAPVTGWSAPVEALYLVNETYAASGDLAIKAIHYHPLSPDTQEAAALPTANTSDFEWIEIRNDAAQPVNLDGVRFAANAPVSEIVLPPYSLAPGDRALIARDRAAFTLRYGSAAAQKIVATWSGTTTLDNGGAEIRIFDRLGDTIAELAYDDQDPWPTRPDGAGSSLEFTGTAADDFLDPELWRASAAVHGTPGIGSSSPTGIVLNEIMAGAAASNLDFIELFNPTASPVDLSGWYLTPIRSGETADDYRHYRFPNGTILAAHSRLTVGGHQFLPNPSSPGPSEFELNSYFDGSLRLISSDPVTDKLLRFEDNTSWDAMLPGLSYGRYPDVSGSFQVLQTPTSDATNSGPYLDDLQLTEIHYHPSFDQPSEFVQITHRGSSPLSLSGWTLRGDADFNFPADSLQPGESAIVVPFNPVTDSAAAQLFRQTFQVPLSTRLYGPWAADPELPDLDGSVRLRRPIPAPPGDPTYSDTMVADEVNYRSTAPWPETASGTGHSIHKTTFLLPGSDPTAWLAATPSPAGDAPLYLAWRYDHFQSSSSSDGLPGADPDHDGIPNALEYVLGTSPLDPDTLLTSVDHVSAPPRLILHYTRRLDRGDVSLQAQQSSATLDAWTPAAHDEALSSEGLIENRRAWIPIDPDGKGFLRLQTPE